MKYCPYCQRQVRPISRRKGVNWLLVIALTLLSGGIFLVIYLAYKLLCGMFRSSEDCVCPICNAKL